MGSEGSLSAKMWGDEQKYHIRPGLWVSQSMVCPLYREADRDVKKLAAQLGGKRCECNEIILCDDIDPDKVIAYEEKKQAMLEEVRKMETTLDELKECRRHTPL